MTKWDALIFGRNIEGIKEYIQEGASPNHLEDDRSILGLAAACGYTDVAEVLIANGADIDMSNTDDLGYTPLIEAAREGKLEMVKLLLKKGADIEKGDSRGGTAFFNACIDANEAMLEILMAAGANVNAQDSQGHTALHYLCSMAESWGSWKITETVNGVSREVENPRMKQFIKIVKILLQHNNNPDQLTNYGLSPLHLAARYNSWQLITMLVQHGANLNFQNANGITALHLASFAGSLEAVKELLSLDPKLDLRDKFGATAILTATMGAHEEIVRLLREKGADISIPATVSHGIVDAGTSPLDLAKAMLHDPLIRILS